jgi:ABC-type multidrug transport system ATPase subunit
LLLYKVRKLVTIGVELVCRPQVLFLDEPTTGLDSSSALATMTLARKVARESGISVLCTIHQPATEIFLLFDTLLLLQKGGRVAYFGPTSTMPEFLSEMCSFPPMRDEENPADYSLTCASRTNFSTGEGGERTTWATAADAFESRKKKEGKRGGGGATKEPVGTSGTSGTSVHGAQGGPQQQTFYDDPFATSSYNQFRVLLSVYFRLHWRDTKGKIR